MSNRRKTLEISSVHGFVPCGPFHKDSSADPAIEKEVLFFQDYWGLLAPGMWFSVKQDPVSSEEETPADAYDKRNKIGRHYKHASHSGCERDQCVCGGRYNMTQKPETSIPASEVDWASQSSDAKAPALPAQKQALEHAPAETKRDENLNRRYVRKAYLEGLRDGYTKAREEALRRSLMAFRNREDKEAAALRDLSDDLGANAYGAEQELKQA